MRSFYCIFLLFCVLFCEACRSTQKEKNEDYAVTMRLEHLADSTIYLLFDLKDTLQTDTVIVTSSDTCCRFSAPYPHTAKIGVILNNGVNCFEFYTDSLNRHIVIEGDVLLPRLIDVKGGTRNDSLTAFRQLNYSLLHAIEEGKATDVQREELYRILSHYIETHNDNRVNTELLLDWGKEIENWFLLDTLLNHCTATGNVDNDAIDALNNYMWRRKRTQTDSLMSCFKWVDQHGDTVVLDNYKGKYLLIQRLAVSENHSFAQEQALYKKFTRKKFEIVTLTTECNRWNNENDSVKWKWIPECKNPFGLLNDSLWVPDECNLLIDPKGKIVCTDISIDTLAQYMSKRLRLP